MKSTENTSRRIPEDKAASPDEIYTAIDALTDQDTGRLLQYARWRVRALGRKSRGQDHEDLLQEAITATLNDNRRWNKESVSFFNHLIGVMRSISNHWGEKFAPNEAYLASEVIISSSTGEEIDPMLEAVSPAPDVEDEAVARDEVTHIEKLVAERPLAWLIMDGLVDRMTGPEIQKALEITQTQYETELKWLRRNVRAYLNKGEK
jgi:DNA-directed RNA polymerase specialized sigma24 family protein